MRGMEKKVKGRDHKERKQIRTESMDGNDSPLPDEESERRIYEETEEILKKNMDIRVMRFPIMQKRI